MEVIVNQNVEVYESFLNENVNEITVEVSSEPIVFETVVSQFGEQGLQGENNYQIAVRNGFLGSELEWQEAQKVSFIWNSTNW